MTGRDRLPDRASRLRAFALALGIGAALVFTWPFVRVPRFHVVPASLHLLAAWALVVAALALLARALRAPGTPARVADDG